jgi:DNA polymerase-4
MTSAPAGARPATGRSDASVLHVDMDAFFVGVELIDQPALRGRPVVVGGSGDRGVVAAASYEARTYGIHSAMPSSRARRLCPHAVFLPGRHGRYQEVSGRVMAILREATPLVEPLSLDEAFLDVRGARRLHGTPEAIATGLRARVAEEEGLSCCVGVARTKTIAKLASQAAKPRAAPDGVHPGRGVVVVAPDAEAAFLRPLPVQALWGVGPATLDRLTRLGVATVGDLADLSRAAVEAAVGRASGGHLHELANGVDDRPVVPDQRPKSIGHEETFARDRHGLDELQPEVVRLSESVAARLRDAGLAGRTVTLKVRFHDFRTVTRSTTLPTTVDTGLAVARAAKELLLTLDPADGVRLLGVHVTGLTEDGSRQLVLALDGDDGDERWDRATDAVDGIRRRFGADAIAPAAMGGQGQVRVDRRGAQPWGPEARS